MKKLKLTRESHRLFELAHKYNENTLNEIEVKELNTLLKSDVELRIIFLSLRDQDINLEQGLRKHRTSSQHLGRINKETKSIYKSLWILIPLLTFLVLGIVIGMFFSEKSASKEDFYKKQGTVHIQSIASISSSIHSNNPYLKKGQDLKPGWIELKEGKIVLEMNSGMEISVSSPAKIQLIHGNKIFLEYGQIKLKSLVERKGFVVQTKYGKILDKGADFGLHITHQLASAQCFLGELIYHDKKFRKLIVEGQNFSLKSKEIVKPEKYTDADQIKKQDADNSKLKESQWAQLIAELKKDDSTAYLYSFKPNINDSSLLIQDIYRGEILPAHGKIIGAEWSQGRFPGGHSLEFNNANDRVKFSIDEEFTQMTMHMWVNINQLTQNSHLSLFLSEQWNKGQLGLQFITIKNESFFKVSSKGVFICESKRFEPKDILNKWHLVSFTFDLNQKTAELYLNGDKISSTVNYSSNIRPFVYVGWCDLMNWVPIRSHDIRNSPGKVDFISIHKRAFPSQEIKAFYLKSMTP